MQTTAVVNKLRREIKANNTPTVLLCGERRSGKTAFAMRIAWELFGDKFKYENVVDSIEAFALAVKNNTHNAIILDEASSSLYIYDWGSYLHKVFNIIQDSQAFRHCIVFIILPMANKLDGLTKFDINIILECAKHKEWDDETNRLKTCYYYKYEWQTKKYSSFDRKKSYRTFVGEFHGIKLPPDHLWLPYISKGQLEFKEKILNEQLDLISRKQLGTNPTQSEQAVL